MHAAAAAAATAAAAGEACMSQLALTPEAAASQGRPWAVPALLPITHAALGDSVPHAALRVGLGHPFSSPNVLSRPFGNLLASAERKNHEVHRVALPESEFVFVPGYGPMPVASASYMRAQPRRSAGALFGRLDAGDTAEDAAASAHVLRQPSDEPGDVAQPLQ